MKKIVVWILVVALLVSMCLSITGCSSKSDSEDETIVLGWIGPLTGDMTIWGTAEMQSLQMLVDETNEAGGILGKQIKLKTYDNRGDAVETTNAAKKAIQQDNCVALFGCNSSTCAIALAEVCEEYSIPQIATTATNSKVTQNNDGSVREYTFRVCLSDPQMGDIMAEYAYNEMDLRTVAIIYELGSDYSLGITQNFTNSFTALGGEIVDTEAYNTGDVDFRAQLTKIAENDFDALFIPANYKEVGLTANQARAMGIDAQLIGPDAWQVDDLFDLAAEAMEGGYFVSGTDITSDSLQDFSKRFYALYDYYPIEIGTNAFFAADAFSMMTNAIKTAGEVNSEKIRDALEATKDLQCLTSTITVKSDDHNPLRAATIFTIKDAKFVSVTQYTSSEK